MNDSEIKLGAVIIQDGKHISFYRCKLTNPKQRYTVTEKELLSIVETLKEFFSILVDQKLKMGNGETILCVERSIKLVFRTAENPFFLRTYINQILHFSRLFKNIKKAEDKDRDR